MKLQLWSSLIALLFQISCAARIDSNILHNREVRQDNYRGNYRFQLPQYLNPEASARTLYSEDRRDPDGSFSYAYDTDNGIKAKQQSTGYGANKVVRGYYSYIGTDGLPYTVNYIADRFGYRAYGAHLPTQPDAIYDQTKFPVRPNLVPQPPRSSQVYSLPPQYSQASYSPQGSLSNQPIYVTDSSSQNFVHVTPKPFLNNYQASPQTPLNVLPPHINHISPGFAWTTSNPINNAYVSTTARPYQY